ncbi:MAG: VWA domain-containing protein, partial [Candidatus Hydrogenedentes bacterium]|nr:VWA domain-containing protein [Candidatus Hydrogenedentota bacterium]
MNSTMKLAYGVVLGALVVMLAGCPPEPKEAIEFSNASLDFERSELPIFLQVWNNNPEVASFTLFATPSDSWIVLNTRTLSSAGPSGANGDLDKQTVQVSVDRTRLTAGDHVGAISFSASGIVTREVEVRVTQDQDGTLNALNVINPVVTYSSPYLIDFSFSLRDEGGDTVVRDPSELVIAAREGAESVASETGVHIQRGAARQLKVALVLDYTLSMQSTEGAIAAMEEAAKNTLLPALNEDALVSITEFHREDMAAMEVVPFTIDHTFIANGIDSIQPDIVQGFSAASRMLDALLDAANTFDAATTADEERYIIVFTDGNDTSSSISTNDVVNRALDRGIRIYALDFGPH